MRLQVWGGKLLLDAVDAAGVAEVAEVFAASIALDGAYLQVEWRGVLVDVLSQGIRGVCFATKEVEGDVPTVVIDEAYHVVVSSERWALCFAPQVGVQELQWLTSTSAFCAEVWVRGVACRAGVAEDGVTVRIGEPARQLQ